MSTDSVMIQSSGKVGKVYLAGAGPGDPGLITVRAVECLSEADVVLHDYLVNPRLLDYSPPQAERVSLGRHGTPAKRGGRLLSQGEINQLMIEHAQAGRTVVRLKGGDPAVFARVAEEAAALEAAGVSYEIVPGITAALAAGSYAGVPVTQGNSASALAIVTGQERECKRESNLDFAALAKFPGTLVFYMGVTTVRDWTSALIAAGKAADTPAAIIRRCSWPDQQTIRCSLDEVAERIESVRMRPPVIVVVGDVAAAAIDTNWFVSRPLFGSCVLVTRPRGQSQTLTRSLSDLGAEVLEQPAIEIGPPDDWQPLDEALSRLDSYDWIVFSSANGVRAVVERLPMIDRDTRAFGRGYIAAIGSGTADELARFHLRADLVPDEFRAEALATALGHHAQGKRVLLVRASRGREVLAESLAAAGATVEQVVAYKSTDVRQPDDEVLEAVEAGRVDWITVTSSAIARSLAAMFGDRLRRCKLASISPITSGTMSELGFQPTAEASEYTMDGVVAAILAHRAATASTPVQ
jgi:uroporphyrinogen III methyltransferase/synthase